MPPFKIDTCLTPSNISYYAFCTAWSKDLLESIIKQVCRFESGFFVIYYYEMKSFNLGFFSFLMSSNFNYNFFLGSFFDIPSKDFISDTSINKH